MSDRRASQPMTGWQAVAAVAIGVFAIAAILFLTFQQEKLTEFQQNVLWAVLALGISAVSAILPGYLDVTVPKYVRAGGALAVFALVYTQSPAGVKVMERILPPSGDPAAVAQAFVQQVEAGQYRELYAASPQWVRDNYPAEVFLQLFETQRRPLGASEGRELVGVQAADNPPGVPAGTYRAYRYRTRFASPSPAVWMENVLVGSEKREWKVYSYTILRAP